MSLYADRTFLIDTENAFKIGPRIRGLEAQGNRVVKCNLGEPDFPLPEHIREEVKRQLDLDNTHYVDPQGILPLRTAIAKQISETRRIAVTPEQVVVFPGGKPPIGLCQEVYCNPGDEVIYPSPCFPIYESFIRYVGAVPRPLHLDESRGFTFTPQDIEALITPKTKLIYLNFPSNPTGGLADMAELEQISAVIRKKAQPDVRVYSDEIYENIIFDGGSHHSIASVPGMAANTIIASGASKSFSWTGGRIGWAAFPTVEEAKVFTNLNINYFSCVPPYNQEGARFAIESPESRKTIAAMTQEFQRRRDMVVTSLNAIDGISCQLPRGAFYVFPNIEGVVKRLGIDAAFNSLPPETQEATTPSTLFQLFLLFRYHVAVLDRKSFGRIGSEKMHFLRLSIATGYDDLVEAVGRIRRAADDSSGFRAFVEEGTHLS
jgi:aspartate/methionine/tyrosine aminotransferase